MIHRVFASAGWIAELRDYWADFAIAYPRMAEEVIRDGTALVTCEELFEARNMGVYLRSEWMVESDIDSATLEQLNHQLESWNKQAGFASLDLAKKAVRDLFVEQDKYVESRRKARQMEKKVPREIVVFPNYSFRIWTGMVKDAMGQQIALETLDSIGLSSTRDDVEQATVALAGRHGITIDSGYLHWDSNEHTAIWLAGDDESPHGWVCCQRGATDSLEDAKLGPIRLERSDAELDREVFGFTEIKFAYDGWLYETDVLEDESDGD